MAELVEAVLERLMLFAVVVLPIVLLVAVVAVAESVAIPANEWLTAVAFPIHVMEPIVLFEIVAVPAATKIPVERAPLPVVVKEIAPVVLCDPIVFPVTVPTLLVPAPK